HAGIARGHRRQVAYGPEVGVKLKALAQSYVDTGESAANRRGHRSLQPNSGALDRFDQLAGNVFLVLPVCFRTGGEGFPPDLGAGSVEDTYCSAGNFRSDPVSRDQRNPVSCHRLRSYFALDFALTGLGFSSFVISLSSSEWNSLTS